MMVLNQLLDQYDWTGVHAVLCLVGVVLGVWCNQLWGREFFGTENSVNIRGMQRTAFILLSVSLCWSLSYAHMRHWQPWPSYVLTLLAVDLYLLSIVIAAAHRNRVTG